MNNYNNKYDSGMVLPELIVTIILLAAFTGIYISISRYVSVIFASNSSNNEIANSFLLEKQKILQNMDHWSEILAQPAYTPNELATFKCSYPPLPPRTIWNVPNPQDNLLPSNYKYCLKPTSLKESSMYDLINNRRVSKPGIYILYAIPDKITINSFPVTRVFCRPLPYC